MKAYPMHREVHWSDFRDPQTEIVNPSVLPVILKPPYTLQQSMSFFIQRRVGEFTWEDISFFDVDRQVLVFSFETKEAAQKQLIDLPWYESAQIVRRVSITFEEVVK